MAITSDIAGLLQLIQSQQQAEERKESRQDTLLLNLLQFDISREESELEREHEESQMFISHNLGMLAEQEKRKNILEDESMKLGLIGDQLQKVDDVDTTDGAPSVFRTTAEGLDAEIQANESELLGLTTNIKNYYAGLNLAKNMDVDASGIVDPYELDDYFETSGLSPELSANEAFLTGVKGYTLTPDKLLQLKETKGIIELKDLAAAKAKIELKFLPDQFKDDAATRSLHIQQLELKGDYLEASLFDESILRQQKMDMGGMDYKLMEEKLKSAKTQNDIGEQQLVLNELAIVTAGEELSSNEFQQDKEKRKDEIDAIGQLLVNNMQAQAKIGLNILSGMRLELEDDIYTPMLAVLSGTEEQDYKGAIQKDRAESSSLITDEILELYSTYGAGQIEEMVPNYSLFLGKMKKIQGYKEMYNKFMYENDELLEKVAADFEKPKDDFAVVQQVLVMSDKDKYPGNDVLKAIQWNNTGIYGEGGQGLSSAIQAIKQETELNKLLERARGLDLSAAAREAGDVNQSIPFSPIPMRYDNNSTAPDSITYDIFNKNIKK